jgi:hypothetical protein
MKTIQSQRFQSLYRCLVWVSVLVLLLLAPVATEGDSLETIQIMDLSGNQLELQPDPTVKAKVFIFILHDCPIANQYQPAIRRLAEEFKNQGVRFHLIHADPDTTDEQAQKHASNFQIESPVYLDPKHELVRQLEATVTPEAVVLDATNTKVYQGRINNLYFKLGRKRFRPTEHDLADALKALLEGKPIKKAKTTAIGCYIPPLT